MNDGLCFGKQWTFLCNVSTYIVESFLCGGYRADSCWLRFLIWVLNSLSLLLKNAVVIFERKWPIQLLCSFILNLLQRELKRCHIFIAYRDLRDRQHFFLLNHSINQDVCKSPLCRGLTSGIYTGGTVMKHCPDTCHYLSLISSTFRYLLYRL